MDWFLVVTALLTGMLGFIFLANAQSAIHEIEAFLFFLIASVLFVGAATVSAISLAQRKVEAQLRELRPKPLPPLPPTMPQNVPPPPAIEDPEKAAGDIWDEARRLAQNGDRDKAVALLKSLVEKYPGTNIADKAKKSLERKG